MWKYELVFLQLNYSVKFSIWSLVVVLREHCFVWEVSIVQWQWFECVLRRVSSEGRSLMTPLKKHSLVVVLATYLPQWMLFFILPNLCKIVVEF